MKKLGMIAAALALLLSSWGMAQAEGVDSKFDVNLYGYVKVDTVYVDAKSIMDNFILFVPPGNMYDGFNAVPANSDWTENEDDPSFSVTARQSRFGLLISGPEFGNGAVTKGRLEMDFYGGGTADENKGNLQLRRATIELAYPTWSVLAGNEWMIMSPLAPHVLNYTGGAEMGNLGHRMPQVRLTKYLMDKKLALMGSYGEKLGDATPFGFDIDTGDDAAVPDIQYGVCWASDMGGGKLKVGFTGHLSQEELQNEDSDQIASNSYNFHLAVPFGDRFAVSGEYFQGANLDGWYTGGVMQGWYVDDDGDPHPLESTGGWVELMVKPVDKVTVFAGYGMDDVDDDQIEDGMAYGGNITLGITKNTMQYANVNYALNPAVKISLGLMNLRTEYHDLDDTRDWDDGVANRYTMSLWYIF